MGPAPIFNIDSAGWALLNSLLDHALDLPASERPAWLDQLGPEYDGVKERLRELLSIAQDPRALIGTAEDARNAALSQSESVFATEAAGDVVGPYRLTRELGRGGMGVVWLAERIDGMIDRPVALKLPRGNWGATLAMRMARERKILAALDHPNIARLYDAGITESGNPWLALELVEGCPIDEYCRRKNLSVEERLRLFLDVTAAVAHAHSRLVVHRDLKPSNVLVTEEGQARLLDFGIARLLDDGDTEEGRLTQIGGCALTPAYASPEQIRGQPIGISSDIYTLGVMLYELLTGASPYVPTRDTRAALEEAILEAEPAKPSDAATGADVRQRLRGDLNTIVLKALAKNAEARYGTVNALSDDIRNHLEGRPVTARAAGRLYLISRFLKRNRFAVGAAAAILITILVGADTALWQARIALAEKERAEEVKAFVAGIFQDANLDENEGRSMTALELLRRASTSIDQRLDKSPAIRIELMNTVGSSLMSLGDSAAAEEIAGRAVAEARRSVSPDAPLALRARLLHAWALMYRGRTAEMRKELDDVFPLVERSSSVADADLVFAWRLRCGLAVDEGKPDEAQAAGREAVRIAESRLSPLHGERLLALLELAYSYGQGRGTRKEQLETSRSAYRLAHEIHRSNLLHPNVMKARAAHGNAMAVAGHLNEGIALLDEARQNAAMLFGPESMTVAVYSQNLVDPQLRAGLVRDALVSSDRAMRIYEKSSDHQSYTYISVQRLHGIALLAARRMKEALPVLNRCVETSQRVLGPSHRLTLENRALRARALGYNGALEDAGLELDEVARAMQAAHLQTVYVPVRFQALLAQTRNDHAGALRLMQESLRLMKAGSAAGVWRGRALAEAAVSQLALNAVDDASQSLEEARTLLSDSDGRMHPDLADVYVGLGRVRMRQGKFAEAFELLENADKFWRDFDPGNRWAGEAALWLARCQDALGRPADAGQTRNRAQRILSQAS